MNEVNLVPHKEYLDGLGHQLTSISCDKIENQGAYDLYRANLTTVNRIIKLANDKRLEITRPMDKAKKAVMDLFRPTIDGFESMKSAIQDRLVEWDESQAQRITHDSEAAEREKAMLSDMGIDVPEPEPPTPDEPKNAPLIFSVEVEDIKALARAVADGVAPPDVLKPSLTALNGLARSHRDDFSLPGCKLIKKRSYR